MWSAPRVSFNDRLGTPAAKSRYVRRLFATIAHRYDLVTVVLSYGRDRAWKRRLVAMAHGDRRRRALDLATGTGDLAYSLASSGIRVVGLDITPAMIALAIAKKNRRAAPCSFLVGDMMGLPFPDRSFDIVTTGYGLRNVPNLGRAIDEIARVLTPGGLALSLEFNRPTNRLVREGYLLYLNIVGSVLGSILHRDPDTYRYIPASIRRYPAADAVARMMEARGFSNVSHVPVFGGLMAIHRAQRSD